MKKFEWSLPKVCMAIVRLPAIFEEAWRSPAFDHGGRAFLFLMTVLVMLPVTAFVAFVLYTGGIALLVPTALILLVDLFRYVGHIQLLAEEAEE
jgi:hypothetical protein